jgi:hypothetical protein
LPEGIFLTATGFIPVGRMAYPTAKAMTPMTETLGRLMGAGSGQGYQITSRHVYA